LTRTFRQNARCGIKASMMGHERRFCGVIARHGSGCSRLRPLTRTLLVALLVAFRASPARAEEKPAAPVSTTTTPPASPSAAGGKIESEKTAPATTAKAAECACVPVQPPLPVFVDDAARLAELTRSDPLVSEQADQLASRRTAAKNVAGVGAILGLGTLGLGAIMRLNEGHWTTGNAATAISGGVLTVAALLLGWAMWPDRQDRLDVINAWNQRHPQDVLWP